MRVETAGKRNAGLIHVMPLEVGCTVPYALQALKYTLAIFELGDTVFLTHSTPPRKRVFRDGLVSCAREWLTRVCLLLPQVLEQGLHALAVSNFLKGVTCILAGHPRQVKAAADHVRNAVSPNQTHEYPVDVFVPSDQNKPYRFVKQQLMILRSKPVTEFQVCCDPCTLRLLLAVDGGEIKEHGQRGRSHMRPHQPTHYLSSPPQVPCVITRSTSGYCNVCPVEVVGWMMRRLSIAEGDWLLLITEDPGCALAAQIVMRAPVSVNVTVGISDLRNTPGDMAKLQQYSTNLVIPSIKEANGLPTISWDLAHAHGREGSLGTGQMQ